MMHADAFELHVLSVEEETLIRVKDGRADAEGNLQPVADRSVLFRFAAQGVQEGIRRTPAPGRNRLQPQAALRALRLSFRGGLSFRRPQDEAHRVRSLRFILSVVRLGHGKNAVLLKADRIRHRQFHRPVDSGTGVPAGIRYLAVIHPDGDHILPGTDEFADVKGKAGIAVGMLPEVIAVDPDPGALVDALKGDADPAGGVLRIQAEMAPVPADAAGKIARAAGPAGIKRMLHRPVMGNGHLPPAPVVITHIVRIGSVPEMEPPAVIQADAFSHTRFSFGRIVAPCRSRAALRA